MTDPAGFRTIEEEELKLIRDGLLLWPCPPKINHMKGVAPLRDTG
jgi:hypothetical protein